MKIREKHKVIRALANKLLKHYNLLDWKFKIGYKYKPTGLNRYIYGQCDPLKKDAHAIDSYSYWSIFAHGLSFRLWKRRIIKDTGLLGC